jgi:hypothetical protein
MPTNVADAKKPRYVDLSNSSLAVECPKCGLQTARFIDHCRNCGYKLWPSGPMASAAFKAWRSIDPARAAASRFDLDLPVAVENVIDYDERAHQLGIHVSPSSNWPFVISFGLLFLALAAIPFDSIVRIVLAAVGGVIFLVGVAGWVLREDVRMFPTDAGGAGEAHH